MKKTLVVYYSRTGVTKKLALHIAKLVAADVEEIIDTKKRLGLIWYILAGRDAALKKETKIKKIVHNLDNYDAVYIGTPVWDFTMSAAIRTYLIKYEKKLPATFVFFCTQASSGSDATFQEMANIVGKGPISTIVFSSKEVMRDEFQEQVKNQLKAAWLLSK